jgi:hypothetical protein
MAYHRVFTGLARVIFIRVYRIFGRKITNYTAIYGAYIRLWPALLIHRVKGDSFLTCIPVD